MVVEEAVRVVAQCIRRYHGSRIRGLSAAIFATSFLQAVPVPRRDEPAEDMADLVALKSSRGRHSCQRPKAEFERLSTCTKQAASVPRRAGRPEGLGPRMCRSCLRLPVVATAAFAPLPLGRALGKGGPIGRIHVWSHVVEEPNVSVNIVDDCIRGPSAAIIASVHRLCLNGVP